MSKTAQPLPALARRCAPPAFLSPMLARPGVLPRHAQWALEVKWDGMRAQVRAPGRAVGSLAPGARLDGGVPRALAEAGHDGLLDGELVCLGTDGQPDFGRLRARLHSTALRQRPQTVTLMVFDLLYLDGKPVWRSPYRQRRALLDQLGLEGPAWQTPRAFCAAREDLAAVTRAHGLEGVVAKRRDAPHTPGPRCTGAWLKIKHRHAERLAVIGWRPGGRREPDGLVVARRAGRALIRAGVVRFGPAGEEGAELLGQLRALQPRGLGRRDRARELGVSVEVHHHGPPGGQLRDAIARSVHHDADVSHEGVRPRSR